MMMGLIFTLSGQPGENLVLPDIVNIDKLLHSLIYGVLALAGLFFLPRNRRHDRPLYRGLLVVLFCLAYGFSDEIHQVFVPGRFPSGWDILADVTGAILAVSGYYRLVTGHRVGNPAVYRTSKL